jgi:hypothetical protein
VCVLSRVPDGQFGTAEQTARSGAAEVADEHRKVGLDPGDVGPKACLAQPTQLLRSRARFVVFPIDGCHSVGGIFGDDDVADDEASAGHDDARDAMEQISLALVRPGQHLEGLGQLGVGRHPPVQMAISAHQIGEHLRVGPSDFPPARRCRSRYRSTAFGFTANT